MTTHDNGPEDDFLGVAPDDAITDVPAEILKELGDILSPNDRESPNNHENSDSTANGGSTGRTTPSKDVTPSGEPAVLISFPGNRTDSDEGPGISAVDDYGTNSHGDSSVVIIDDETHGSTIIINDDHSDRIVIVDDDSLDTQFEARRARARRREKLKKVRWLLVIGSVVSVFLVIAGVMASPLFSVQTITIEGNVYTSTKTLESASALMRGKSIFTLDTDVVAEGIEKDPWVADARVSKHFLRSIVVEIRERVPVLWYVGADNKARVIDDAGYVISVLTGWPTKYLQVAGVGPMVEAGQRTDDVYRAAAQLVTALPDEIRSKTQRLELSVAGSLSLILKTGTIVRFGEPSDLQNKLVAVVVLLRRQDPVSIKAIDVSTGDPTVELK